MNKRKGKEADDTVSLPSFRYSYKDIVVGKL